MTTCAFDGEILATDSRATGSYIQDYTQKIFKVGSAHIAVCGTYSYALLFVRWYRDQTKEKPHSKHSDDGFEALVIRGGKPYIYDNNCVEMPAKAPVAVGSGCHLALGAMAAGVDAKKAVEIARKYDEGTGGKVQTVKIK